MNLEQLNELRRQRSARNTARAKIVEEILDVRANAQTEYKTSVNAQSTRRQLSEARTTLVGHVAAVLRKHNIIASGLAGRVAQGKCLTATQFYALPTVYSTGM